MRLTLPRDKYPGEGGERILRSALGAARGAARRPFGRGRVAVSADGIVAHAIRGSSARRVDGQTLPTALITVATPDYFDVAARTAPRRPLRSAPADRLDVAARRHRQPGLRRSLSARASIRSASAWRSAARSRAPVAPRSSASSQTTRTPVLDRAGAPRRSTRRCGSRPTWNQLFMLVRSDGRRGRRCCHSFQAHGQSLDPDQPVYFDADDGRGARDGDVSAAGVGDAARHLRRAGAGPRGGRHLRRHVVRRQHADAGDGRASCRRRAAA